MKKNILLIHILFATAFVSGQTTNYWTALKTSSIVANTGKNTLTKKNDLKYQFDLIGFEKFVQEKTITGKQKYFNVSIPNPSGEIETFKVKESSNFTADLQMAFPNIRCFSGNSIEDPTAVLHFSLSQLGIQTIVLRSDNQTEFIESLNRNDNTYKVFNAVTRETGKLPLNCTTKDVALEKTLAPLTTQKTNTTGFRTLRLALSCTGEYAQYFGGTKADALAGMNATLTRVNAVFNKDLSLKLILIDNTAVIYTNPNTDPYSDPNVGTDGAWSTELQTTLDTNVGFSNYDIGHLFGASGGGGNSFCIGCVCDSGKGSGYTSPSNSMPEGDTFDIDFVIHEMGHQLGANHTFSHSIEGTGANVEPGSGSTIMGYAGITAEYDIQSNSDDYFVYKSIQQIQTNLASKTCPTVTSFTETAPTVNAGSDYTIPKGTAFVLTGTGSDSNGNILTYTWDQNDSATNANNANSLAIPTKTNGPLFRSLPPSESPIRYMPNYTNVLNNQLTSDWESVASVARSLHFVLTARNNAPLDEGQTASDETTITVSGSAGPFEITSLATTGQIWYPNRYETIRWNVNNSNSLSGSSTVDIKLSIDGGKTFTIDLATDVSNDGSHDVLVPDIYEANCRIMIAPTDNIFYAINKTEFSIGYEVTKTCQSLSFTTPFEIPEQSTFATKTIVVPTTTETISDVNLNMSINHTYFSDIEMELESPEGTIVKLFENNCSGSGGSFELILDDAGSSRNCDSTVLQTVKAVGLLSSFNGENPSGTWTLRYRDNSPSDDGIVNQAKLEVCSNTYTIATVPTESFAQLKIYPNPSDGDFNIYLESDSSAPMKVVVYDVLGQLVYQDEFAEATVYDQAIDLGDVQSGLYFIEVSVGNKSELNKIIIY